MDAEIISTETGLAMLRGPILPLVRLLHFLFMATPHEDIEALVGELTEPIETDGVLYGEPDKMLFPFLKHLALLNNVKEGKGSPVRILDESGHEMDSFQAVGHWVAHGVLMEELERINSLLCGPCHCDICCTGPADGEDKLFFEIPLREDEKELFQVDRIDIAQTRLSSSDEEPPLQRDGRPFYESPPALYRWRDGWSLILPKTSSCPHLSSPKGKCLIYPDRPDVCRRPQIFSYLLERIPCSEPSEEEGARPTYIVRNKLLAVWDCPYVRQWKDLIGRYAELCGLVPVFKMNKVSL